MIVNLFKNNNPAFYLVFAIICLLIWVFPFLGNDFLIIEDKFAPLFNLFIWICNGNILLIAIVSLILLILNLYLFNWIFDDSKFFDKTTFVPAFAYLLIFLNSHFTFLLNPIYFFNLFILLSIFSLYGVYRNDNPQKSLFDSGLFFGIACLFFLPAIPIILFLFIFIYSTRSFVLKEYIINIIGVIVPFIFAFAYCYLFDKLYLLNFNYYKFNFQAIDYLFNNIEYIDFIKYFFSIIFMFYFVLSFYNSFILKKIKIKKYLAIFIYYTLMLFILMFFVFPYSNYYLLVFSLPIAVIFSNYLYEVKKNWISNLIVFVLIVNFILSKLDIL